MEKEVIEFRVPDWALPALINGDYSGLSDEDKVKLSEFCESTYNAHGNANFSGGSEEDREGFCHSNDIDSLGADCYIVRILGTI